MSQPTTTNQTPAPAALAADKLQLLADVLRQAGLISQGEYDFGRIFPVTDDGMAPHLLTGGFVHAVKTDPHSDPRHWPDVIGKIVVVTNGGNWFYIGRLLRYDSRVIHAVQDNKAEPSLLLETRPYHSLYVLNASFAPVR